MKTSYDATPCMLQYMSAKVEIFYSFRLPCMLLQFTVKDRSFCGRIELPRKGAFTMNYSKELKDALLRRMLPPNNESITKISKEEGISEQTLRNWRDKARRHCFQTPMWSTQRSYSIQKSIFAFQMHICFFVPPLTFAA